MKSVYKLFVLMFLMVSLLGLGVACTGADAVGIGAQCAKDDDCKEEGQKCFTQFKGGYCSVADCKKDTDCPSDSACVTHTDGKNYCFRSCKDKSECNANRDAANESNCSSNVNLASGKKGVKVCVPPAGA